MPEKKNGQHASAVIALELLRNKLCVIQGKQETQGQKGNPKNDPLSSEK
jgi:hypothetical protein